MLAAPRLKIGISACLLGESVRYDGTGKKQNNILTSLADSADLISFCPEVEAGLGIPRKPIQLVQVKSDICVLQVDDDSIDSTQALRACAAQSQFSLLHGYIVKARSPSCGFQSTPVWAATEDCLPHNEQQLKTIAVDDGEFVRALRGRYPQLPFIDEEAWRCKEQRTKFLAAAKTYFQKTSC